jgi:hypothetical protein
MNSNSQKITCPECNHSFQLDEAFSKQIEASLRSNLETEFKQKSEFANKKLAEAESLKLQLAEKEKSIDLEVSQKLESEKKQMWIIAQQKAAENSESKMKLLQEDLESTKKKQLDLEKKELDFVRKMRELEDQKRNIELDFEKKFTEKARLIEASAIQKANEEASMKFKEKELQVEQMRKTIEELKRKSEQGSMQVQGDTLENDLKEILSLAYPVDVIDDVPTGIKGADLIHKVRTEFGQEAGTIIWESKNTKAWNDEWIRKLKEDQAEAKADVAVLVSKTLPEGVKDAVNIDSVWVVDYKYALLITNVLRANLINISKVKKSLEGTDEKMVMLHKYLTGNQFKNRIENIVLAFTSMQQDLDREKRLFQKQWAKREKEIERVVQNTTGLYGDLNGVLGQGLQSVPLLEFDEEFEDENSED